MQTDNHDAVKEKTSSVMEYALVAMLIAVSLVGGLKTLGTDVDSLFRQSPPHVTASAHQHPS